MTLSFGYINIEGLTQVKLQACCSLIDANLFDVLVLSETWFTKSFDYMSHPYSLVQSHFSKDSGNTFHSVGGLLVLTADRVRPLLKVIKPTVHGILLDLSGLSILSVYLPPSMPFDKVQSALSEFPPFQILLGDINVRFKHVSTSKQGSEPALQERWRAWLVKHSLSWVPLDPRPLDLTDRVLEIFSSSHSLLLHQFSSDDGFFLHPSYELDHAFYSGDLDASVRLLGSRQFRLQTVHPYFIMLTFPLMVPGHDKNGLSRFYLGLLEKPGIPRYICRLWDTLAGQIDWNDIRDVDVFDSVLANSIQVCARFVVHR